MNKKKIFLLSNLFFVTLALLSNTYILLYSEFQAYYILLVFFILALYFIVNKPLVDDIFHIETKLKDKIEKTMHEINTPVSTIQINTEMLLSTVDDQKSIKRLNNTNKACLNLLKLYEDMEYYIKKEIEDITIENFDIQEQIKTSLEKKEDILSKKGIAINNDIQAFFVNTDKNGFEIILDNLISNAIIHNTNITTLWLYIREGILYIKDNGEGINSNNIYKIFDKYYKTDQSTQGFGIGLHIVKKFCDEQSIDIKISSSSAGTTISLNLKNIEIK